MKEIIKINIDKLIDALSVTINETQKINKIVNILITAINKGKKIFVYGNGCSFADSSHFVGELTATYKKKGNLCLFFF